MEDVKQIKLDGLSEYFRKLKNTRILKLLPKIEESLRSSHYSDLTNFLSPDELDDPEIMMPLLYSVRNEFKSYAVYKHCGEKIQSDRPLTSEVIEKEPELLEGTVLSQDTEFIKENVKRNPGIMLYMDDKLKQNHEFVEQCFSIANESILARLGVAITSLDDPSLKKIVAEKDAVGELLAYTSEEKNNYEAVSKICRKSDDVINYIAEHTDEFGIQGLVAAKDVIADKTTSSAIDGFRTTASEIEEQIKHGEEQGQSQEEIEELQRRSAQMTRHADFFERIKADIESGKLDPAKAAKRLTILCKNMDPEYRKKLENLLKIDETVKSRETTKETAKDDLTTDEGFER